MHTHKLTESDSWFIEKGLLDSNSRSPFTVGDIVVVCNNKHVMLFEFYDGECISCSSTRTVPFSQTNIMHKKIEFHKPLKIDNLKIEFPEQSESEEEFLKWFFPSSIARRVIPKVNLVLKWLLGIIVIGLIVFIATDEIPNDQFLIHFSDFWVSSNVSSRFIAFNLNILSQNRIVLTNFHAVLGGFGIGSANIVIYLWTHLQIFINRTMVMLELIYNQTTLLIELISSWLEDVLLSDLEGWENNEIIRSEMR